MGKIQILDQDLVNKIAAGEVVERPASVVKELLDNSYDANASMIIVDVDEGGTKKILVIDNGDGMDKEDAIKAFQPHATSKIKTADDLLNIKNYGFRGEALSSIAAVSKVTLKTRAPGNSLGTEIIIEGGNLIANRDSGAQVGTSMLIEDLFYNVPARKEFLNSVQTEYREVLETVNAHALANPLKALMFSHNGKNIYNFPKEDKLEDRIRAILGIDFAEKIIPVFFEHPHLEIYGFVGKPELAAERKKNQYLFVNKRLITHNSLSHAVKEAYGTLIPSNTYPPFAIFIDVATNIVDVNVHPRKEEVKFSDEKFIYASLNSAVKKALDRTVLTPGTDNKNAGFGGGFGSGFGSSYGTGGGFGNSFGSDYKKPVFGGTTPGNTGYKSPFSSGNSFGSTNKTPFGTGDPAFNKDLGGIPKKDPFSTSNTKTDPVTGTAGTKQDKTDPLKPAPYKDPFGGFDDLNSPKPIPGSPSAKPYNPDPFWDDPFGYEQDTLADNINPNTPSNFFVLHNLYIITETETGLLMYDQHALHERILYEKFIEMHKKGVEEGSTQKLMAPVVLNLSVNEADLLNQYLEEFKTSGLTIEPFGGNAFRVTDVPVFMVNKDIKTIIHEMLNELEDTEKTKDVDAQSHRALRYLSCRTAYKAGDAIPTEEINEMLNILPTLENEYTCPHGRPLKVEITFPEIEKMFKRT